jgi:regulator of protease activity HflC (stomatin/prohibitin superfamily)
MINHPPTQELKARPSAGFFMLFVLFAIYAGAIASMIYGGNHNDGWLIGGGVIALLLNTTFVLPGFFIVAPNDSRVLVLFGSYTGTVKDNGFFWVNPFTSKHKVSLKARSHNGATLKVNDKGGNPVEIAAIVVWQVKDTYAAKFDVEDYEQYVASQSESAIRKLAALFHYDGAENEITLRGSTQDVSDQMAHELTERLHRAGVDVIEARISHLAYAPEIAHAMLQRQQAAAVIAARSMIVDGAVGMVEMALNHLKEKGVVDLDHERRAAMVSNLMVVLCSERTTPVINAGSLYT